MATFRYADRPGMSVRTLRWILRLAGAQVRHRPSRWALLALGVAMTAAIPVIALGSAAIVSGQTARRTVAHLDPGDRAMTVIAQRSLTDTAGDPATDSYIDAQFSRLSSAPTRRELLFRQLTVTGSTFFLGGTNRIGDGVRVVEGRLPQSCTPKRCEVILVGAGPLATLTKAVTGIGLVVVGRGERTDPTLISGPLDVGGVPLLMAGGVDELSRLDALSLFGRSYAWVRAVDVDHIVAEGVPAYVAQSGQVAQAITDRILSASFERPDQQLSDEDNRARLSSRRFGLLGGTAAALLIGFAVLAAIGLRPDHGRLLEVLRRRGAGRLQLVGLTAVRAFGCCAAGAVIGYGLGAGVVALLARAADTPVEGAVSRATSGGLGASALLLAAAGIAATAVLYWPEAGGRRLWSLLDVVAIAALAAALLAGSRGSTSTASLASGSDPLVTALPVLAAVTGGLVAARLVLPAVRLVERLLPRRATASRIALVGAARRPLRPVATAAFLTAAVASVVFTGAYRATLLAAAGDQAAFQVPLDARLVPASDGTSPLQLTSSAALAAAVPGAKSYGVVRGTGSIHSADGSTTTATLVGVDAAAITAMHNFARTTGASIGADELARLLALTDVGSTGAASSGPVIPAGTRRFEVDATGTSPDLALTLTLAGPDGLERGYPLNRVAGGLAASLPGDAQPQRVVAISVRESDDYSTHHTHNIGEGTGDEPLLQGVLGFSSPRADGESVPWNWSAWASVLGQVKDSSSTLSLTYRLAGSTVVATPVAAPTQLRIAADPVTAARAVNGLLPLQIDGRSVPGRIVAVVPRLPTVDSAFVLVLRAPLVAALDATQPNSGSSRELWIAVPAGAQGALNGTLAAAPLNRLGITDRSSIEHDLASDPVGRGSRQLLILVAVLALLAAGAAIVLLVIGEQRDGAGELFAWEADGVRPSVLRRTIFLRALAVLLVGLPVGLATGLILAVAGTRLVAIDAAGVTPVPPLQAAVGVGWSAAVLAAVLVVALALAGAVCAGALRARTVVLDR